MITPNRNEYDYIISLGGNCNVSEQLKHRGLRKCSFPLDSTLMKDSKPVKWLPFGILNRFSDFALQENMEKFEAPANEYGIFKQRLEDLVSGYRFIHQFTCPPEDKEGFTKERRVIERRIKRFYDLVSKSKNVLFVLGTNFEYEDSLAKDIYNALAEAFPMVDVELICMQFAEGERNIRNLMENKIHIAKFGRRVDIVYDNQLTSVEWRWMDGVRIKGYPTVEELRKKNFWVKMRYKLWMKLGRSLERDCAGCCNMRFRDWTNGNS